MKHCLVVLPKPLVLVHNLLIGRKKFLSYDSQKVNKYLGRNDSTCYTSMNIT